MRSHIIGVGMTKFGRQPEATVKSLVAEAATEALADAGAELSDIRASFFATALQGALEGQHAVAGEIALRDLGLEKWPVVNVENACASGDTALFLANAQVRAGLADVALVVGVERMSFDKPGSFDWFNGCWDVSEVENTLRTLDELGAGVATPADVVEPPEDKKSLFMDVYASLAKQHIREYGTTERELAAVASKNHGHSVHNRRAQYQNAMSVDEVLAAPMISWPITVPMCSPISDGAAAVVICSDEALSRFEPARAVPIAAIELGSGSSRGADELDHHLSVIAAERAYERAGIGPEDIDVAEVHDATSFGEILQTENLGLVPRGEGGAAAARGETTVGGRIPVNLSGGLVSKGHPIAATGLGKTFELTHQLRGDTEGLRVEGARWAISQGGGGWYGVEDASSCVTILGGK